MPKIFDEYGIVDKLAVDKPAVDKLAVDKPYQTQFKTISLFIKYNEFP